MRVWLLAVGEPWPTDGGAPRLLRMGIHASYLASRGHDVLWWNGTFDHRLGIERPFRDKILDAAQGYRVAGLYGGGYAGNVSVGRILHNRRMARDLRSKMPTHPWPDVIVASLTPLELARAAVEQGERFGRPVIIDIRDMWPDTWIEFAPRWIRPVARVALKPFYDDLRRAIRGAAAVIGITEAAVDWGLSAAGRARGPHERAFPLVYPPTAPEPGKVAAAAAWWRERGVGTDPAMLIGCYFGALTVRADFATPIRALQQMPLELRRRFKIVLCGRGEAEPAIRELAAGMDQVVVPGWIDAAQIKALMDACAFGLLPYRPTLDYTLSLPNKVFEYLNGGLPIVTSLRGVIEQFFADHPCGALYEVGDPQSFQAVLTQFAELPDQIARLTRAARRAAAAFDGDAICAEFEAFLLDVATGRTGDKIFTAGQARV